MNWEKIFPPDLFIQDMINRGELVDYDLRYYDKCVVGLCHNSCAWMLKRAYDYYPGLSDKLFLVTGSMQLSGMFSSLREDHSWVEYRDGGKVVMLDLTLSQFRKTVGKLYVGDRLPELNEWSSISFSDKELAISFLMNL